MKIKFEGRGAQFGNLHLEVNFGTIVDVGHVFWYASGPGILLTLDLEEGEAFDRCETRY